MHILSVESEVRGETLSGREMLMDTRLLTQIFDLLEKRHIKPVHISKKFTFSDVHSAFRYMRSGNNIGKTVVTRGSAEESMVPVSQALVPLQTISHLYRFGQQLRFSD